MIVPLRHPEHTERFIVRWSVLRGNLPTLMPGYAVYDGNRRITITWRTRAEAERHRTNIAALYARYGW